MACRMLWLLDLNNGFRFSSLLLATVECFRQLYAAPPLSCYLQLLCLPFSKLGKVAYYKMTSQSVTNAESVYDFTVKDANGDDVNLSKYRGKVLLIVNVASKCGMTNSNYTELNHLYEKYKDQGLEILAFPCNQFGEEEPGSNEEIKEHVCTRFKSEFPILAKIDVNGQDASLLYKFLKSGKWGIFGDDIQWNFAKFLVDKNGQAVDRYYPTTSPLSLERDIEKLLSMSC